MRALRRAPVFAAALVLAVLAPLRARAACNKPDLLYAVPPDGAANVPPNARLTARYAVNAEYLGEEIVLEQIGVGETSLTGEWNAAETLLTVTPTLVAGSEYEVRWPRLRGLNTANLGRAKDVRFTVGGALDEAPPVFGGLSDLDWDVERERDDCTDSLEERYVFDFELAEASDDGGRESLMLVVFQTRGPYIAADAPEPVLIRSLPPPGEPARLSTPIGTGLGDVCFAAIARDLTGKPSASGAREVCAETVEPPFFAGCGVARTPAETRGVLSLALLLALGLRRGRRR